MVKIIFFATLVIFPFGQLFKIGIVNLFDVLVLLLAIVTILKKPVYPSWFKYFVYFVLSCIFGLSLNYQLVTVNSLLYLVRLISYAFIAVYVSNFYKSNKLIPIPYALISVAVATAIFGWLQYLIWPDLTALKYLGWDDHLLRMVGTFLDPTYLGLILVLGIIIALNKKLNLAFYFLAFSILFTYSRVSYLLLFLVSALNKKYVALIFFVLVIFFLPKNVGEGTTLTRTVSGNNKLINYSETIDIIKKSPVWGIGFNNMCAARKLYLNDVNIESHACNGADSSILFLLATTGVIGFVLLAYSVQRIVYSFNHSAYFILLTTSFTAVLVHSLFSNSLFYPHIMFWLFVLVGLQTEVKSK